MNLRNFFSGNRWLGKFIGAFIGYFIGGPAGALFGILIGNFIDISMAEHYARPFWHYHVEKRQATQRTFFEATFSVLGHIAKADGYVSRQEINIATTLMHDMGLNRAQMKAAQDFFTQGKSIHFNLSRMLQRLQEACQDNPELLKLFMDIQYRAAFIDGLSEKKLQALDIILRRMGFAPLREQYRFYEDFRGYRQQQSHQQQSSYSHQNRSYQREPPSPQSSLAHAYAILELDSNANKQETKSAYRRLISRNHPDKLIAKGLPEEMIKMANEKTQKITKAYEQICLSKGW